jgi:hypothetical protein
MDHVRTVHSRTGGHYYMLVVYGGKALRGNEYLLHGR